MSMKNMSSLAGSAVATALLLGSVSMGAHAAPNEGLRVVRDPQTGQLRAPTADEVRAAEASRAAAPSAARGILSGRANPQPVRRADGVIEVELTEDTMSHSVVTIGADGKLVRHCVASAAQAERLASGKIVSFAKNMMERGYEEK